MFSSTWFQIGFAVLQKNTNMIDTHKNWIPPTMHSCFFFLIPFHFCVTAYLDMSLWLHKGSHYSEGCKQLLWLLWFSHRVSEECRDYSVIWTLSPSNAVYVATVQRKVGTTILQENKRSLHWQVILNWKIIKSKKCVHSSTFLYLWRQWLRSAL